VPGQRPRQAAQPRQQFDQALADDGVHA
jgi:hypothetical protein